MRDSFASASEDRRRCSDPRRRHNEDESWVSADIRRTCKDISYLDSIIWTRNMSIVCLAWPSAGRIVGCLDDLTIWYERLRVP